MELNLDNMDERPGCLGFFANLFKKPPSKDAQVLSAYSKEESLLNGGELAFYEALKVVVGTRFVIMAKVRQEDIFKIKHASSSIYYSARNKVSSFHVDFLLCEPNSMEPILIIELDGRTHQRDDRRRRDAFLDEICKKVNLRILHYPGARRYDPPAIYEAIVSTLRPTE